jgi:large subunit ribosomal protein L32
MPVPRRRHSKARRDRARTHKKLHAKQVLKCEHCGANKLPHRICPECGRYGEAGHEYKTIVKS